ncbi:MAG: hypothetical protein CMO11_03570 [Thaumarchaeota archaeon]|nr:hypothetical protein [Nitrososphaerota archaeon]
MLGKQLDKKRVRSLLHLFVEIWIKKFYITIPLFFFVWSFAIPYMVYEMLFTTFLLIIYYNNKSERKTTSKAIQSK